MKLSRVFAAIFAIAFIGVMALGLLGFWRMPSPVITLGEYVPGIKRWAGPFGQLAEPIYMPAQPVRPDVTIEVKVYTSDFDPRNITVKEGQVVKLVLKGMDNGILPAVTGIDKFTGHGFHVIGPYDIWVTGLREGVTREVLFTATTPGEFDIECTVFCSLEHYKMRGKLIVKPKGG